ncbi:iron transport multicopper oxidase fet3 [Sarocladium strictum]
MTDVERASFLREGLAFNKEHNYGDTGRKRFWCAPRRKLLLTFFLVPLISGIALLLYLYAEPVLDRLPKFGIAPPADIERVRDFGILLQPDAHTARRAKTQCLSWTITKSLLSPDGVEKQVFQINGQFPGPTVEARSGDVLEIEVLNMSGEDISMHWHGLYMRGANDMDGPVGITQCGIPPGKKFTYTVPTGDQAGTFWYHAHSEAHRGEGLYGGLIIHDPAPATEYKQYDKEMLLMIGDWYHPQSLDVLAKFQSFKSEGFEPCPDSLLINGMGQFVCSNAVPSQPVNCTDVAKPQLNLDKRLTYRFRVVNIGSMTGVTLTVPGASLQVINVDGGLPIVAQKASSVGALYPAERMDIIVSWEKNSLAQETALHVQLDDEYFMEPNHALTPTQAFAISSKTYGKVTSQPEEETVPSSFNLREAKGLKLSEPLPEPDHKFMIWSVVEVLDHNHGIPQGVVNRTSWQPQSTPILALPRSEWDKNQLVAWTGVKSSWVELTINNIDGTGHPFHLHGHDFYVIGTHEGNGGWDYYNPYNDAKPRGGPFNFIDPLKKDTVYVPAYGYVVLRFLADNEGMWALHCHIMWHQASGMSMAFQVFGDEVEGLSQSEGAVKTREQCKKWK